MKYPFNIDRVVSGTGYAVDADPTHNPVTDLVANANTYELTSNGDRYQTGYLSCGYSGPASSPAATFDLFQWFEKSDGTGGVWLKVTETPISLALNTAKFVGVHNVARADQGKTFVYVRLAVNATAPAGTHRFFFGSSL